jgi:hypothetical protein
MTEEIETQETRGLLYILDGHAGWVGTQTTRPFKMVSIQDFERERNTLDHFKSIY